MVEIDGISLIDRQLSVLRAEGLDNIVMVGGYKSEMLKREGVKLKLNPRYYETNMVWTLFAAEEELEGDLIVSYGDIVYSRKILRALLNSNADIAVTIDKQWESYWKERSDNPLNDAETLRLRKDGTISEIGQKPEKISKIEGQYMGLMKFSAKGLTQIKNVFHAAVKSGQLSGKPVEKSYMTDLLQEIINSNISVMSVLVYGGWVEVDTVKDMQSIVTKNRLQDIA
jgi:choline kinase